MKTAHSPLPPLNYTIKDFEFWCKHLGHYTSIARLESFKIYCGIKDEQKSPPINEGQKD